MKKARLEAFSDGVLAIIITIMVLEMKVPHGSDFTALQPLIPVFISYVLSFIYIGIYWNNHHHMLHTVNSVNGSILWANLHLLFWLSVVPFATSWIGQNPFSPAPVAIYGFILLMAAIAYWVLQQIILKQQGEHSTLAKAVGKDLKGKMSPVIYIVAILSTYFSPVVAECLYLLVAFIWLIPDKRIERVFEENGH